VAALTSAGDVHTLTCKTAPRARDGDALTYRCDLRTGRCDVCTSRWTPSGGCWKTV